MSFVFDQEMANVNFVNLSDVLGKPGTRLTVTRELELANVIASKGRRDHQNILKYV